MAFEIEYLHGVGNYGPLEGHTPSPLHVSSQAEAEASAKAQYPMTRVMQIALNRPVPSAVRVLDNGRQTFLWTRAQAQAAAHQTGKRH